MRNPGATQWKTIWNRMMAATIVGCTGLTAQAQPSELDFLLPTWDHVVTIRAGGGYKENVTLAHTPTESRPFFTSGVEALLSRLPKDNTSLAFMLSADDRRYLGAGSVDHEQIGFFHSDVK